MTRRITGRVTIRVDGEVMLTAEGAKASGIGGAKKEPVMDSRGEVAGYVHKSDEPPRCEFPLIDTNEVSLTDLADSEDVTVTFEAYKGKILILQDAFCEGGFELDGSNGQVSVIYYGSKWVEQLT